MYCKHFSLLILFLALILIPHAVKSENKEPDSSVKNGRSSTTPIDCPLRTKGVEHHHRTPFGSTDKYIEFLERKERIKWQKPDAVIESINLKGSEKIADVGAGSGYFSFRFASALSQGRIYAIDIEPEIIHHIRHKAAIDGIKNIEVILAKSDDPKIPIDSEIVFICDVLHHVENKSLWLKKISDQVTEGTRLIVIEFKEGNIPEGPPEHIKMSQNTIISKAVTAGFTKISVDNKLLPYQTILVFER